MNPPSPDRLSAVSEASVATTPPVVALTNQPRSIALAAADAAPLLLAGSLELLGPSPPRTESYVVLFVGALPLPQQDPRSSCALARLVYRFQFESSGHGGREGSYLLTYLLTYSLTYLLTYLLTRSFRRSYFAVFKRPRNAQHRTRVHSPSNTRSTSSC